MTPPTSLALIFSVSIAAASSAPPAAPDPVLEAAQAFLATLGPEGRAAAAMAFDADERFNWHFTAKTRQGLPLKRMSDAQRKAATALLRASLSANGFDKAEAIRRLEDVLFELEGRSPRRDREMYYFTVFGTPSAKGVWGWRYEGHHLSFNFTVTDGKVASTTPQFLGANPAEVRDGPLKGTRVLAKEEDLARALLLSLGDAQRKAAIVGAEAPHEILTAASRRATRVDDAGVAYSALDEKQQVLLLALIEEHALAQRPEIARARLERIRQAGLEKLKFAWMGGPEKGAAHYYRVQGPTFLVEYDNTQNGANHAHAVWRDFEGDWGADLLAEHYRTSPHHARR